MALPELRRLHCCFYELVPDTLSAQDTFGRTPAHYAAAKGHMGSLRCLRQLLPETVNTLLPAEIVARQGHTAASEYLDACHAWTPLMFAAVDRLPDAIEELLHNGADPTAGRVHQSSTLTPLLVAENLPQAFRWGLEM